MRDIEVTSYVSPKWVPQKGDAAEVMAGIRRQPEVKYSVLVLNMKGFETLITGPRETWPHEIMVFGSASEAFSQKNTNCSIAESIERLAPVVTAALAQGIPVRGAISCAVGCPYEGEIAPGRVGMLAGLMKEVGMPGICVADTIGVGTPAKVQHAMEVALQHYTLDEVTGHFHDAYGQALAYTLAAPQLGVWQYDTSIARQGGCTFARGATGNVATEDVIYMLHDMGVETGIHLGRLIAAGQYISEFLGRKSHSRATTAVLNWEAASSA